MPSCQLSAHDLQVEEAVAHEFQRWRRGGLAPVFLKPIFEKIDRFLRQVAAAAAGSWVKDAAADDIFTRIETGEVGAKEGAGPSLPALQGQEKPFRSASRKSSHAATSESIRFIASSCHVDELALDVRHHVLGEIQAPK